MFQSVSQTLGSDYGYENFKRSFTYICPNCFLSFLSLCLCYKKDKTREERIEVSIENFTECLILCNVQRNLIIFQLSCFKMAFTKNCDSKYFQNY